MHSLLIQSVVQLDAFVIVKDIGTYAGQRADAFVGVMVRYLFNDFFFSGNGYHCELRNDLYCVEWGVKLYSLPLLSL